MMAIDLMLRNDLYDLHIVSNRIFIDMIHVLIYSIDCMKSIVYL